MPEAHVALRRDAVISNRRFSKVASPGRPTGDPRYRAGNCESGRGGEMETGRGVAAGRGGKWRKMLRVYARGVRERGNGRVGSRGLVVIGFAFDN